MSALWLALALAVELNVVVEDPDGDPVVDAVVTAPDEGTEAPVDGRGRATLELPEGTHRLVVSAAGYVPRTQWVKLPRKRKLVLAFQPSDAAYEVVVEGLRTTADPARHVVDAEKATETPGTLDDAVRLVQSLPSVTVQREYSPTSGDLSVRGSAPGENRYLLDGIEIPYLYHFNQYASVFPTSQIGTLELLPSTFSGRFGDAVGAVVDAHSRLDAPRSAHGSAHVNFVMVGGDVRAPVSDEVWVSASGRRSYQDLGGDQTSQYPVWPVFHDFVVRVERGDEDEGTGAFVMSAGDSYERAVSELDLLDPVEAERAPTVSYGEGFEIYGMHHRFREDAVRGRAIVAAVRHHRSGALTEAGREELLSWTGTIRADLAGDIGSAERWNAGLELRASDTSLEVEPGGPEAFRVAEEVPALARGEATDGRLLRRQLGVYAGTRIGPDALQVLPSVRAEIDDAGGGLRLEPRALLRAVPVDGTALKLAGGRYTQRPDTEWLFEGAGDPDLPTTTSWQVAAGVEQAIAGRLELAVDSYWKALDAPLVEVPGEPITAAIEGRSVGGEATARYRLRERFFTAAWVGVQQTEVRDDEGWRPADGDQRLAAGWVMSLDVGRTNLGARYRLASGLPFTPVGTSLYDAGVDQWVPRPARTNSARYPAYHKLDLRVAYTWTLQGWTLTASAEVWLVPKPSAQLYPTWNFDYSEQGWVVGPTVLPLLGLRARF